MSKHQNPGSFSEYSQIRNLPFLVVHIEWFCEWLLWISTHFAVAKVIGIAAAILVFFTGVIQFQQSIESNIENKINVAWSTAELPSSSPICVAAAGLIASAGRATTTRSPSCA